ncbi:MAG: hypothetical protein Q4Q24_00365 [Methanobrevibacter ruminantium]|uniref:hypothetical protein n=1 Tax=Methanobrevibacter ruminantium TaxID=83816 RepID=UPI0026F1598A|nr:hypothetical protein [Methanobrevibacter ruminantium]MDO5841707.1 hypothetical protein [Methanobrevibacter ruminantium]
MTNNSIFDWHKFHVVGCRLYESGSEENLRTAINRFYYGSFCQARDYLIHNNIFYDEDLKNDLCSGKGVVHEATRLIFLKEKRLINHRQGKKIHDWLVDLRDYRNRVDYNSSTDFNLEFMTRQSKIYSEKIFNTLENL